LVPENEKSKFSKTKQEVPEIKSKGSEKIKLQKL